MKEIRAIIQPAMLSRVIGALEAMTDLPGATVSEVKGFGKSRAVDATQKVVQDEVEYGKNVKPEIVQAFRLYGSWRADESLGNSRSAVSRSNGWESYFDACSIL